MAESTVSVGLSAAHDRHNVSAGDGPMGRLADGGRRHSARHVCTHLARSVALRTCSGNTLAQPEVPDKHAFATSGAARGYVGMRGAGHTRPDDHLKGPAPEGAT